MGEINQNNKRIAKIPFTLYTYAIHDSNKSLYIKSNITNSWN